MIQSGVLKARTHHVKVSWEIYLRLIEAFYITLFPSFLCILIFRNAGSS